MQDYDAITYKLDEAGERLIAHCTDDLHLSLTEAAKLRRFLWFSMVSAKRYSESMSAMEEADVNGDGDIPTDRIALAAEPMRELMREMNESGNGEDKNIPALVMAMAPKMGEMMAAHFGFDEPATFLAGFMFTMGLLLGGFITKADGGVNAALDSLFNLPWEDDDTKGM